MTRTSRKYDHINNTLYVWQPGKHDTNVVSMLGQRRIRWPNIETALVLCIVYVWLSPLYPSAEKVNRVTATQKGGSTMGQLYIELVQLWFYLWV